MSKKIIIFMMSSFLLFSLLFISFFEPSHASGEINNSTNGLGKTINIVKDGYSEFDSLSTNHDVLNNEWLQSQLENVQSYDVTRTTEVISANSIEEYQNQFSMMINTENALGAEFNNIVFASIEKNFNFTGHLNYEDNITRLQLLSHRSWCTKTSTARMHLMYGDIHILLEKGEPRVALRFFEDVIDEVQSVGNRGINLKDIPVVEEYVKTNGFELSENVQREINKLKQKHKSV